VKYRIKLTLAFIALALFSTALGLLVVTLSSKSILFNELRSKVLTVATTAAAQLNGEDFKNLNTPGAENTPQYKEAKKELQKIRDANRRSDLFVEYVYTMQPGGQPTSAVVFGVDAEEVPEQMAKPGETVISEDLGDIATHLDTPYVDKRVNRDPWGYWLSAFAPITDKNGNYVATLGIDMSAAAVSTEFFYFWVYRFVALGISLVCATILAFALSHFVTKSLASLCSVVKEIGEGHLDAKASLDTHDEFNELATAINQMTLGLEERERLKANFAKYVSAQVLERILKLESFQQLEGERRKITVLFSDIRDFTRLAEKMPPEKVVLFLNEYFDKMIDIIFKYYGTLDKFMGDGIMVEFGAPLGDTYQEQHALFAAIDMLAELDHLNDKWKGEGKPVIRVGIGINTGLAVVGNIGSIKRVEYTAIGDTVNVAARLEEATKLLQQTILLGEATYQAIKDQFPCRSLGDIALPGRDEPIRVYTIDIDELRRKTKS
jgi:adenylate cyclase